MIDICAKTDSISFTHTDSIDTDGDDIDDEVESQEITLENNHDSSLLKKLAEATGGIFLSLNSEATEQQILQIVNAMKTTAGAPDRKSYKCEINPKMEKILFQKTLHKHWGKTFFYYQHQ